MDELEYDKPTKRRSVVSKVEYKKQTTNNQGMYTVEFQNGDKGAYFSSGADSSPFVEGADVEYQITRKVGNSPGSDYYNIRVPDSNRSGGAKFPAKNQKAENARAALAAAALLAANGKIDTKNVLDASEKYYTFLSGKTGE